MALLILEIYGSKITLKEIKAGRWKNAIGFFNVFADYMGQATGYLKVLDELGYEPAAKRWERLTDKKQQELQEKLIVYFEKQGLHNPAPNAARKKPPKQTKKKAAKKTLRRNRFSVRCHSYQRGYLMFEGSLTKTEAERVYKKCKRDGYEPAIFDGRKKIR